MKLEDENRKLKSEVNDLKEQDGLYTLYLQGMKKYVKRKKI